MANTTKASSTLPKPGRHLLVAVPVVLFVLGPVTARAGEIKEAGVIVCVNDKWDEKEVEKSHKLIDYAGRCVDVPDDPATAKQSEDCVGKYEYMPDQSFKGSGTCVLTFMGDKTGDKLNSAWEEGSGLKAYPYKYTGGTGKYKGASGDGTYFYESLTDSLLGGRYKGKMVLP